MYCHRCYCILISDIFPKMSSDWVENCINWPRGEIYTHDLKVGFSNVIGVCLTLLPLKALVSTCQNTTLNLSHVGTYSLATLLVTWYNSNLRNSHFIHSIENWHFRSRQITVDGTLHFLQGTVMKDLHCKIISSSVVHSTKMCGHYKVTGSALHLLLRLTAPNVIWYHCYRQSPGARRQPTLFTIVVYRFCS